jgi:YfiH family protein
MMENIHFPVFDRYPELVATISTKADGNCYFAPTGDAKTDVATPANRASFLARLGIPGDRVVSAGLVHGGKAHHATTADDGMVISGTDALFAQSRDFFVSITVADCLPIFLFDPEIKTFGLMHAGWRGLVAGVIPNTMRGMIEKCGIRAETLLAAVGPGIGVCHFEVKDDVAQQFAQFPDAILRREGKIFVDLKAVARTQLLAAGVKNDHLEMSTECTYDSKERYFSWRRDKPPFKETMMAVIGLQ